MIIVDTDILIDTARDIQEAIDCLHKIEEKDSLAISSVTEMELIIGCRNKNELHLLENYLNRFQVIKLNEFISDKATMLLKRYRLGHGLLIADSLIAATAIIENFPLISKNQHDYKFIEELSLLAYPNPTGF